MSIFSCSDYLIEGIRLGVKSLMIELGLTSVLIMVDGQVMMVKMMAAGFRI